MAHYLYRLTPARGDLLVTGPTPTEAAHIAAHFTYLEALSRRGVVRLAGRTLDEGPDTFGLVIFEAVDEPAARAVMEGDPAVVQGVMQARLWPFRIALP
ncbi:YciI family protein [Aeromonas schubertii]|uniref:YciI family protein n=1 Tax=Aeromonas schubertii TaxID=652 RepID=UPI001CC3815F|nr:YciI family protein [Aeromonas schubertii]MBZ6070887.1 YciI family protein [Aeromonas schubertii]